ncbi:MAG: HD domain-containing protein [Spirochaetaceae bacterium]|nr:HD domain-containing protein [Spirochaetaceae bacterium]
MKETIGVLEELEEQSNGNTGAVRQPIRPADASASTRQPNPHDRQGTPLTVQPHPAARLVPPPPPTAGSAPAVKRAPSADAPGAASGLLQLGIQANVYNNCLFSVLMIDANFQIIYSNMRAQNFFSGYFKLGQNAFFDLFGKYFTFEGVRGIRAAVLKGESGYCWRGKAEIKSRNHPKVFTRVYIYPANITAQGRPSVWTVLFDDVTEESRSLLRSVFVSLLEASKLKDNDTGKHITRVNYYAEALAKKLFNRTGYPEVDAEFIDNIGFLAAMHDVGKIGTPDDVLNKQGPLSDWEWNVMKEHTKNGAFILSTYPNPMAKEIAQSHHEKWNGKGYPFGIDGKNIPLAARIVSIADVYDALRMKRCYKPSYTHEVTMEKMMESKGSQFDPELLDIFAEMAGEFNKIYEANKDMDAL